MSDTYERMNRLVKRILCIFLITLFIIHLPFTCFAEGADLGLDAKSAILMEASSGTVLYSLNEDIAYPPASVTKIMTLLLIFEALDSGKLSWNDTVTVSETAASMGGSQVFLKAGEQMCMEDMIKSVVIASANDAAVALGEHLAGSLEAFTDLMNKRAKELDMTNTVFYNPTGLDDGEECNMTSAGDIAIMSRELLKHEKIFDYTVIWMDSIRNGAFGLTNTNRLIRFYKGANGLKTGSTSKAGFCISATALRDGMQLIAVVMGSPTRDIRNETAKKLLDYGFANYAHVRYEAEQIGSIRVMGGVNDSVTLIRSEFDKVIEKGSADISIETDIPEYIEAPVSAGDKIGTVTYKRGDEVLGTSEVLAGENVDRIGYLGLLFRMIERFFI
ncbi:MAG: D-alanyl-D-alanine carboxypeptidase [Ruminococcaceae bacterium]|nr:D-alanyl-D-alanine carboxypeptidase [Oscillospiraceae bacterium]